MSKILSIKTLIFGTDLSDQDRLIVFEKIYQTYQSYVRKTLFWMVGENALDDLVQEVFVKIWKNLHGFEGRSSQKTWIYRITVNTAYDYFKREKKNTDSLDTEIEDESSQTEQFEKKDFIHRAILKLKPKWKDVFVLHYKEELSVEEIAGVLQVSAGTVKSRLHYARQSFIETLNQWGIQS